jgi:hypothetical protein
MVRAATGLDPYDRRLKPLEKRYHLLAPQLPAKDRLLRRVDTMQLKDLLRRVHTNSDKLLHGRSPSFEIATTSFWHIDAVGGRPPHLSDLTRLGGAV